MTGDEARAIPRRRTEKVIDAEPVAEPVVAEPVVAQPAVACGPEPVVAEPAVAGPAGPALDLACSARGPCPSSPPRRRLNSRTRRRAPRPPRLWRRWNWSAPPPDRRRRRKPSPPRRTPEGAADVLGAAPGTRPPPSNARFGNCRSWSTRISAIIRRRRGRSIWRNARTRRAEPRARGIDDAGGRRATRGKDSTSGSPRTAPSARAQGTPAEGDEAILRGGNGGDGGTARARRKVARVDDSASRTAKADARGPERERAIVRDDGVCRALARTVAEWTDAPKDAATREARLPRRRGRGRGRFRGGGGGGGGGEGGEGIGGRVQRNEGPRRSPSNTANAPNAPRGRRRKDGGSSLSANAAGKRGTGATGRGGSTALNRETDLEAGRHPPRADSRRLKKAGGDLKGRFGEK